MRNTLPINELDKNSIGHSNCLWIIDKPVNYNHNYNNMKER